MTQVRPATTRVDIDVRLRDTFTLTFPILDAADAPVSVAGWTARAQVRHTPVDALLYEWATAPTGNQGEATVSGTTVALLFDGTATAEWAWRRDAQFDLLVFESDGTPHCVAAGRFRVIPHVTQAA